MIEGDKKKKVFIKKKKNLGKRHAPTGRLGAARLRLTARR